MYTCCYCNFSTPRNTNYKRHLETSKHKKNFESFSSSNNNKSFQTIITKMETKINKLQESNQDLKSKLSSLETSISDKEVISKTTSISCMNINQLSLTQNVNIVIRCFGNESIEHLGDTIKKTILNSPNMALRTLLKYIHFNPNKKEYQNIKWTNMKNPVIKTLSQDGWNLNDRDECLDELCNNLVSFIEDIREQYSNDVFKYKSAKEKMDELLNILNDSDDNLSAEFRKKRQSEKKQLGRYLHQLTKEIN